MKKNNTRLQIAFQNVNLQLIILLLLSVVVLINTLYFGYEIIP